MGRRRIAANGERLLWATAVCFKFERTRFFVPFRLNERMRSTIDRSCFPAFPRRTPSCLIIWSTSPASGRRTTPSICCLMRSRTGFSGERPWAALRDLGTGPGSFTGWVDQLRAEGTLKNDDVTVLRVDLFPGEVA